MKVTLKWLNDYVSINAPVSEVCHKLTMAGLEVAEIKPIGGWKSVVVGEISEIKPHPNADRLRLATVNLGTKQQTVVCGAPNLSVGDRIAFAAVGAELIDGHSGQPVLLKPAKIRGITSEGMICSEKELGISDSHEGILVLEKDAPIGAALDEYLGDTLIDIEVTPNRPDCLSVIGIAREIAAQFNTKITVPNINYKESDKAASSFISIEIKDADLCPRYCASVITDVKLGTSPGWMQKRLLACGMRPISNIVDITNYVMLEYGQPLHSFDYNQFRGQKIIVRRAHSGETMTTLDGVARKLDPDMLMIADEEGVLAIAGIMGGEGTGINEKTSTVLIESANFNQAVIHRGSLKLKLNTEASSRFEKGLSPELALQALKRAMQLMQELAQGKIARGIIDVYPGKLEAQPIRLSTVEIKRLLGVDLNPDQMVHALELLGFEITSGIRGQTSEVNVITPWWRTDVNCVADLVEEVARIIGYDNLPTTMLNASLPEGGSPHIIEFRQKAKNLLVGCGLQEVLTYSLTNLESLKKLSPNLQYASPEPLKLDNPMSRELECLRTSIRSGILMTLARNQRFGQKNIKLFELGKVFLPNNKELPHEKEMLCGIVSSEQEELFWREKDLAVDFYIIKGIVETLLSGLGLTCSYKAGDDAGLEVGQRSDVWIDSTKIGIVGKLHHAVCEAHDIDGSVFLFELDCEALFASAGKKYSFKSIPKYPDVIRDLALVVDNKVQYQQIHDLFNEFKLISRVNLFDYYIGDQVPSGKKSLAFRIWYRSEEHTLTDIEVDRVQKSLLDKLYREFGAVLRV